jgi:EAL and modified HD-GYP domain-containing signal transduction protein
MAKSAFPAASPSADAFLGRQPIYDRGLNIFGYELLFRGDERNAAKFRSGEEASLQVILNALVELGLEKVSLGKPLFVNFTRELIVQHNVIAPRPDWCVLEVLEDVSFDEEVAAGLRAWRSQGYRIALDDFSYTAKSRPLVNFADFVKLDVRASSLAALPARMQPLKRFPVKLLAEKIGTHEEFRRCKTMGFDYFQGYFLSRPEILKARRLPVNRASILALLAKCLDAEVDCRELAALVGQDATLSYRLLQALNSALSGRRTEVSSILEAVLLAGVDWITRLVTTLLLSGLSDKPSSCIVIALERARVCELIGEVLDPSNKARYYTAGLLSALDILLDKPLDEALESLPLAGDLRSALLTPKGPVGLVLAGVLAYEQGEWDAIADSGLDLRALRDAFWCAAPYVHELQRMLSGAAAGPPS